ncbi:MAG: glycosyltransferase family 2 protein [Bacteroidetes bacterium]|nr:glycosyltransferase family 2 protein [Bacteroidota bacterium]
MTRISVIIVNYNTGFLLGTCISSVMKYEDVSDMEFIIVDNASTDNSREIINTLTQKHAGVKTVYLDSNRGFGYANNRGVDIASGGFVLILNS